MVQIDVPIALGVGSIFADAANRQLRSGRAEYHFRAFYKNILFQCFFFSWIPVYFLCNYFGWETTHMWWHAGSVSAYPYFLPIFLLVFFAAAVSGFAIGAWLVGKGNLWANRAVYIGIFVYAGIWIFSQTNSTFRVGTYQEWVSGNAPWFYTDPTFVRMLVLTLVIWAGGAAVFALQLWNEGKHLDPPLEAGRAKSAGA
ncbi:MAG TPA: hypothetical protein VN924_17910 [Bryobacteraceae bacterium]|jgi:hypothetical protein|nr:hypothetical protein [Bryobacteraceae bacterium]